MAGPPTKSAAVQIVRPPSTSTSGPGQAVNATSHVGMNKGIMDHSKDTARASPVSADKKRETPQRICRNVMIYGFCKFQDAGCVYYHPPPGTDPNSVSTPKTESPALTNATPLSKESKSSFGLGAEHLSAPVFVPKTPMAENASPRASTPAVSTGAQTPSWPPLANAGGIIPRQDVSINFDDSMLSLDPSQSSGMDSSIYMQGQPMRQPLDYHLYTSPLSHVSNPPPSHHPLHSFFIPDDLRRTIQSRQEAIYTGTQSGSAAGLPAELGVYHSLIPIGPAQGTTPSKVYGHPAPVYKAMSSVDGNVYCLRRIEGFKLVNEAAFGAIDTWRRIKHPNIVTIREAFTTKAFNDNSLILVYDYHPLSTTLWEEHLASASDQNAPPSTLAAVTAAKRRSGMPIPERVIWSYITQIANALKAIHNSNLAARNLDPSKVLVTGKNRIRLNGCGVLDVLAYDAQNLAIHQQEDLVSLGKLILTLCYEFFLPGQHPAIPLDHISRHYSPDLKQLVIYLITQSSHPRSVDDVVKMMGPRILNELDAMQNYSDVLENELSAEVENGRIVRLLTKLGFINERAEFELDPRWSDTGDRYILKLFRDYVFHSIGVDGTPILDLSHVLTCLNKLDAGLDERIMLVSRDDQSCLVVSYREIKLCIETTFNELRNSGNPHRVLR
ncbi:hypothetical protein IAR55_005420 [Kwoniella newhampshirensis]|uniref:PAN2-PAN3 deadenylation complex subunit PAN3 n=1 Tax=Kwoniella newhampshirensis TaxID=1651941 RepID=A0AAW0YVV0_9TREE